MHLREFPLSLVTFCLTEKKEIVKTSAPFPLLRLSNVSFYVVIDGLRQLDV